MNIKEKKQRLQSFKNEVKEFHPLLDELLRKIPNIMQVEYTHGGDKEFGADFVLIAKNPIFNEIDHVGVIAKIGKILQDFRDIDKQIEECQLPRLVGNGKNEVFLNQILVVSNSTISANAQKKIHHKYRSSNIRFIDGSKLIDLIDQYLPNYWFDIKISISKYLENLWSRNDELDKKFSLLGNDKRFYIEPDIYEYASESYTHRQRTKRRKKINIFEEVRKEKVIIIEGAIGSGKSKLLRRMIDYYSTPENYIESNIFPVYTTFKKIVDAYEGNLDKLIQVELYEKTKKEDMSKSKILLLIDAIDEKAMRPDEHLEVLSNFITSIHNTDNINAVFTSRSLNYVDVNDVIQKKAKKLEIRALSTEKIIEFIQKICSEMNISNRIIEDLKKSSLFKELPKTPISAILLAKLLNENSVDLPTNLTELYSMYIELILGRWDIEKGLQEQKEYEAAERIIMNIAEYMMDNELFFISYDEAKSYFTNYLSERNLEIDPDKLMQKILERSEILVFDESKYRLFFKHRTFLEYFYAKLKFRSKEMKIDIRAFEYYWMNVYFFYLGLHKDCPDLLKNIISLSTEREMENWLRIINMGNYFLAAYQSPYNDIQEYFRILMTNAAQFYDDIVQGKIKSHFSQMSEIYLLWFFQIIIRDSYSYEFFRKAIDDSLLKIEQDRSLPVTTKVFSSFFISAIASDLGVENPYDFLLKTYSKDLPPSLDFALYYESKKLTEISTLHKKQSKHIMRNLKKSKNFQNMAELLHDKSIARPNDNK